MSNSQRQSNWILAFFREHPALLVSLKEPLTWLIVVLSVLMVTADNAVSRRVERNSKRRFMKWYGSDRYRKANYIHPHESIYKISFQAD